MKWQDGSFQDTPADILEQVHFTKNFTKEVSHDLFIPLNVEPNDVAVLKLLNLDFKENQREDETKEKS